MAEIREGACVSCSPPTRTNLIGILPPHNFTFLATVYLPLLILLLQTRSEDLGNYSLINLPARGPLELVAITPPHKETPGIHGLLTKMLFRQEAACSFLPAIRNIFCFFY